jgi:hypothetical protein
LNLSDGVWGSPGGDAKQYKSKEIDIRWYPDTQSITLAGKLKDVLKLKLISLASISEQLAKTPEASDHDDYSDGHEGHVASPTHPDVASPTNSDTAGDLQNVVETIRIEMKTLKNQLTKFQNATNSAIKDLREASIKISDEDVNEDKDEELKNLRQENEKIKDENKALTERINNLAYTLADLNNKAKIAENEKASLVCALGILQDDSKHASIAKPNQQKAQWRLQENRHGKKNGVNSPRKVLTADKPEMTDFAGTNKYNPLQILSESQNDDDAGLSNEAASPAVNESYQSPTLEKPKGQSREKSMRTKPRLSSNLCGFLLFSVGFYLGKILKARGGI